MTRRMAGARKPPPEPVDARVDYVEKVVDGDTIIAARTIQIGITDVHTIYAVDREPRNMRLLWVDTPEDPKKADPDYVAKKAAWTQARTDLQEWIAQWEDDLRVRCHGEDNFGRLLVDVYVRFDPDNTASKWLMIEKHWPPFTGLRPPGDN